MMGIRRIWNKFKGKLLMILGRVGWIIIVNLLIGNCIHKIIVQSHSQIRNLSIKTFPPITLRDGRHTIPALHIKSIPIPLRHNHNETHLSTVSGQISVQVRMNWKLMKNHFPSSILMWIMIKARICTQEGKLSLN